jgi:hypothetical protein
MRWPKMAIIRCLKSGSYKETAVFTIIIIIIIIIIIGTDPILGRNM